MRETKWMVPAVGCVPLKEKIGYSLGDSASNLYWKVFEFFVVIFYTDVFGMPAAAVGIMLLIVGLSGAAVDLIMGSVADRTTTRWGHFRPYLLWGAVPLALAGVLAFSTPQLASQYKIIYAYITYCLLMLLYTFVNVPYSALMGVMTENSVERTSISSVRFIGALTAGLFVQYFTLRFVKFFGHGSDARGWQLTMTLYGVLAIIMLYLCFVSTRERVTFPQRHDTNILRDYCSLFSNGPWLILASVQLLSVSAFTMRSAASAYYFKYFIGRPDLLGVFLVSNGLAILAAVSFTPRLARWIGKKVSFQLSLGLCGLLVGLNLIAGQSNLWLIFALQILSSFAIGFKLPLVFAMFADIADHVEWSIDRRITGLVFASVVLVIRMGVATGAWIFGVTLAYSGYVSNVEQATRSRQGILLSMSVIPCVLLLLATVVMAFYPLNNKVMVMLEMELKKRRAAISIGGTPS
ncbi:MAG: MFS transporter [Terracidiphilus sp.]